MMFLELLLFSLRLLSPPSKSYEDEILYRMGVAQACAEASSDRTERYLCMKIPRFESNYREDVGRCEIKGPQGELGAWQILPRTSEEKSRLCHSLAEDAAFAIERIRESRAACRALPKEEQLALYARGSCGSTEGRKLSRHRWPYERGGEVY